MLTHQHQKEPWFGKQGFQKACNDLKQRIVLKHHSCLPTNPYNAKIPIISIWIQRLFRTAAQWLFPWVLSCVVKSWEKRATKGKTRLWLVQSLTFLTKQSKLISAENEKKTPIGQEAQQSPPSADMGPHIFWWNQLIPWPRVMEARLSCQPASFKANQHSHLQLLFTPAIGSVFKTESRQMMAEGFYFLALVLWGPRSWDRIWATLGNCISWRKPKLSFLLDKGKLLDL